MKTFKIIRKTIAMSMFFLIVSYILAFISTSIIVVGILMFTYNRELHYQPVNLDLYRNYQYGLLYFLTFTFEILFILKFVFKKNLRITNFFKNLYNNFYPDTN